mgnify:CR=1 FL=1
MYISYVSYHNIAAAAASDVVGERIFFRKISPENEMLKFGKSGVLKMTK